MKFRYMWTVIGVLLWLTVFVMAVTWYPEGNAARQGDTQERSLQKMNDLMYNSGNGLKVQATFGASTNQIWDAAGRLLSLNDEGSIPVTLPAASHVTVTPETTTSAVADGQALSYNFTVTVPRTNSYLTQVIVTDTETNAPGSMNLKAFDLIVYSDAVTAQTPANPHQVTPAEMAKTLAIYSVATTMWFTNRAVNTYAGGGVVHCPGFARMTNSVNGNILCIPAGTQLTCSLKGRATYTPQATNTISVGFDFLPMK